MTFSKNFLDALLGSKWKLSEDGSVWAYFNDSTIQSVNYHPKYGLGVPEVHSSSDIKDISALLYELARFIEVFDADRGVP